MTKILELPDDVAVLLQEKAAQRGMTVAGLISETARQPTPQQALEAFIGSADAKVGEPFDIPKARAELADKLLREHDILSGNHT